MRCVQSEGAWSQAVQEGEQVRPFGGGKGAEGIARGESFPSMQVDGFLDAVRTAGTLTLEMEDAIRKLPEVVTCHYISGTGTFELQVVARDLDSFSQFARDVLLHLPNVKDMHTSFSLGEVKAGGALPLSHLDVAR